MQYHLAEAYGREIRSWRERHEYTFPHKPLSDEDIWIRIGCKWPTLPQEAKQQIFRCATGRKYECSTSFGSSRSSPYSLDSSFTSPSAKRRGA